MYFVQGRSDLENNTKAVHYLVKYWAEKHNVLVINTYLHYRKELKRYLDPQVRRFYKRDYTYDIDGIRIYIIDNQLITKGNFIEYNWRRLKKHIKLILQKESFAPDVVISHFPSYSYEIVSSISATKRIAILHQSDVYHISEDKKFLNGLNRFDKVFARSATIRDYFLEAGVKVGTDIIYSGAPTIVGKFERSFNNYRSRKLKILYAGKLIKRKNVNWIIDVISKIGSSRFSLEIIGNGPEKDFLQKLVIDNNLEGAVSFSDEVSREKVLEKMCGADIFCMPSINETFGLVYIEAMSCGCVTIATRGEGIDGIIQNGKNGYLVSSKQELEYILSVFVFEDKEEDLFRISREARETGIYYSEKNVSDRYLQLVLNEVQNEI